MCTCMYIIVYVTCFKWYIYEIYERGRVKPVLRRHLWDKEKVVLQEKWSLKRGSIHMKFTMTGQEKGELLIQVTA